MQLSNRSFNVEEEEEDVEAFDCDNGQIINKIKFVPTEYDILVKIGYLRIFTVFFLLYFTKKHPHLTSRFYLNLVN